MREVYMKGGIVGGWVGFRGTRGWLNESYFLSPRPGPHKSAPRVRARLSTMDAPIIRIPSSEDVPVGPLTCGGKGQGGLCS